MTLERKRWWNGLSANEKYLRRVILAFESKRSAEKLHVRVTWSRTVKKNCSCACQSLHSSYPRFKA